MFIETDYIDITTAANRKGTSRPTIYNAIARGRLNVIHIEGRGATFPVIVKDGTYAEWEPQRRP